MEGGVGKGREKEGGRERPGKGGVGRGRRRKEGEAARRRKGGEGE